MHNISITTTNISTKINNSQPANNTPPKTVSVFSGRDIEFNGWLTMNGSIALLGAVLNLLALIGAWPQSKGRRSSFALLISHYAGVHLFMCLVNIPTHLFMVLAKSKGYDLPRTTCIPVQSFWGLTITLINWSDAILTINRCAAIFLPHYYAAWSTVATNVGLIVLVWMISVVSVLIPALSVGFGTVMVMSPTLGSCSWSPSTAGVGGTVNVYMATIAPFTITGMGAVLILCKSALIMRRSRIRTIRPDGDGPSPALRYRMKMARMLLLTYMWTAVCLTPGYVILYCFPWATNRLTVSYLWTKTIPPIQYGFPPCIMLVSNKEYRNRLANVFGLNNNPLVRMVTNTVRSNTSQQHRSTNM